MIVDDAMYIRAVLKKALEGFAGNLSVLEASTGKEAVALFEQEKPDLVLMDITMPEMDGITATATICASNPGAKIVICSALGQQQMVIDAVNAGAKDYITKPFQPDQVLEIVKRNLAA